MMKKQKKEIRKIEYTVAVGRRFSDQDAKILGPYLTELAKKYGRLTRQLLLEDAENNAKSPVRNYLEWDDATAARRYRLAQVGEILRSIKYRVTVGDKIIESRVFENVVLTNELPNVTPGRGYVLASTVYQHADLAQQVLDRALKELKQWQQRYKIHEQLIKHFAYIFQAIDTWEDDLTSPPKPRRPRKRKVEPVPSPPVP